MCYFVKSNISDYVGKQGDCVCGGEEAEAGAMMTPALAVMLSQ